MGSRPLKHDQYDESIYDTDLHWVLKTINFITGLPYRLWGNRILLVIAACLLLTYAVYTYGTYLTKIFNM